MKTMAAMAMAGGTDNNQLKALAEVTMAAEETAAALLVVPGPFSKVREVIIEELVPK
jgi:hypothetical protein